MSIDWSKNKKLNIIYNEIDNNSKWIDDSEWFCYLEKNYLPKKPSNIIGESPSGEIFRFSNQRKFARENNLVQTSITSCLKGRLKTHRGWKFRYE